MAVLDQNFASPGLPRQFYSRGTFIAAAIPSLGKLYLASRTAGGLLSLIQLAVSTDLLILPLSFRIKSTASARVCWQQVGKNVSTFLCNSWNPLA